MPEGDTVHKLAVRLHAELAGTPVRTLEVRARRAARLADLAVIGVDSRGKHLFVRFGDGLVVRIHLGMYGAWHRYAPAEPWKRPARQARVILRTDGAAFVCFNAREVELLRDRGLAERDLADRLGPDLLAQETRVDAVCARARRLMHPATPMVDVLLDQRIAAGIGNVYKSELLFLHGQDPGARLGDLDDGRLGAMYARAADLLRRNLGAGPRVTRPGGEGRDRLWVYGRSGLPCLRCGSRVTQRRMGSRLRSTYWCPACQPGERPPA